jgi:hypothetical protein
MAKVEFLASNLSHLQNDGFAVAPGELTAHSGRRSSRRFSGRRSSGRRFRRGNFCRCWLRGKALRGGDVNRFRNVVVGHDFQ